MSWSLAEQVYAAMSDGRLIFLDVPRDRYFKLDRRKSESVAQFLREEVCAQTGPALLEQLSAKGLIFKGGRALTETVMPSARGDVFDAPLGPLSFMHAPGVFGACAWAGQMLRRKSLSAIVAGIAGMRREAKARPDLTAAVARIFLALRPIFPRDNACLFDALALMRYLLLCKLDASWVFGVRGAPFAAHCWVATPTMILNDDLDAVRCFTPILVI